ncbi:MAG TPA: proline iminopeptidase-family hydrolase [Gaiellales bacterium]|nr:proline iminopeptidase-family hydrolase [Gaiellales bacterium]
MAQAADPTREGTLQFELGDGEIAETWFRITGDLQAGGAPLVLLHGGPGATHDYLLSMTDLASNRAVIHYDQLGNGRSSHYPERGADFWTVDLFVRELHSLVSALGIADRHHVLGQSWGGFLAQEYALTQPAGLRSLILADTAASFPDFVSEANRLRADLPPEVEATLRRHEEAGTTDDPAYMEACQVFYARHVCRLDPMPPEVVAAFEWIDRDPTVYHTMNGPSEFHVVGSIRDWQSKDRIGQIHVPTLLVSGRHDEATPALQETLQQGIAGSEWVVFEESSHMPHVEERERFMQVVGDWLARRD